MLPTAVGSLDDARQILPGVVLAQVQLLRLAAGQLGDMEGRRLIALLAFHSRTSALFTSIRILSAPPRGVKASQQG